VTRAVMVITWLCKDMSHSEKAESHRSHEY